MGIDVRAGPTIDEVDGKGISFFDTRSLPTGERVSSDMGRTRFVGGELEVTVHAILQDLFGAAGTLAASVYEAFNAGDDLTSTDTRIEAGLDQLGKSLLQQARYAQPLFGKSLRNHPDITVARSVIHKVNAIEKAAKGLKTSISGGEMAGDLPAQGAVLSPTQDPVQQALEANSGFYKEMIAPHKKVISQLRNRISTISHTLRLNYSLGGVDAGPITIRQRDDLVDALNLQIDAENHSILALLKDEEASFATEMGRRIGRDLTGFTFDGYTKLPNPSSTSQVPPKRPQTSQ
jgi:hypothetical protein